MSSLLAVARVLWDSQYAIFLISFRSFAKSPTRQSIGYLEIRDARAGIKWVKEKIPDAKIGLIGASLGATTALRVAAEFPDIVCVCADCPFATLPSILSQKVTSVLYVLPQTIVDYIVTVADSLNIFLYNYSMSEVSSVDAVSDPGFTFPLFLIHSECDVICPLREGEKIFEAAVYSERKTMWRVPNAQHLETSYIAPREYSKRVVAFFDDCYDNAERVERNQTTGNVASDEGDNGDDDAYSPGLLSYINPVAYLWDSSKSSMDPEENS